MHRGKESAPAAASVAVSSTPVKAEQHDAWAEGEAASSNAAEAAPPDAWAEAARAKSEKSEGEDKSWAETGEDSEAQAWAVPHHKGAPWDSWAVQKGTPSYGRPY